MSDMQWFLSNQQTLNGKLSSPTRVGGTDDYEELNNKPSINGVELVGDKSFEQLGEKTLTNSELKEIIDTQFELIFGGN